jgi:2-polyprenyl-3-methyl-5-hydroxy-6-metoxy-1,4-benzoquinol methylase
MPPDPTPTGEQLRDEWTAAAPAWIERIRSDRGDPSRRGLLDDWMLDAVCAGAGAGASASASAGAGAGAGGDVRGLDIIDLGCGEGTFGKLLASRGAHVTGIDACPAMIDAAHARRGEGERYFVDDMQELSAIRDAQFDLATSYVSLVDVPDFRRAIAQAFRVLRPGGRFIVCNLAPMVTAGNMWVRYGDGTRLHFRLDNYCDESVREMPMCGVRLTNFHRTLSSYINAFLAAGFVLEGLREPVPNTEQLAREPTNDDMLRVPLFIIYLLRKP